MKSKSRILLISTIIIFILTIFIGTSYSLWQTINTQDSVNTATTKCFNVEITSQKNSISLENAYPITNEKGKKLTPFSFTITNTCDIFASYTVSLESLIGTTLSSKFLNAMINNEEIKKLSDYEITETVNTGSIESHILAKGSLGSGDSEDYTLRVWIDYDTTMEDLNNETKTFKSKIIVKAQPSSWSPVNEGYTTLHDAILANEYQTTPEKAISKIESKGTPDLSKTAPIINWEEKNAESSFVSVTKLAPTSINSDNLTDALDESEYKMRLCKEKTFNKETGVFYLNNCNLEDPTQLDFKNKNYYFSTEYMQYDEVSKKIKVAFNYSNTYIYQVTNSTKDSGKFSANNKEYDSIIYKLQVTVISGIQTEADKSDKGLYYADDDYGISYYYRGSIQNNYVKFADFFWRIIRINGDGTIRLIYNGTVNNKNNTVLFDGTPFNEKYNSPAYAGYMFGKNIGTRGENIKNEENSTVKSVVDNWYKSNLTTYSLYIADNGFCNDRSLYNGDGASTDANTNFSQIYRSATNTASLKCDSNDLFTLPNSEKGNKSLDYPVGLPTYDELILSGLRVNSKNPLVWTISEKSYWTMTPTYFMKYDMHQKGLYVSNYYYGISEYWVNAVNANVGIRPVISLKSDVEISGGIGTINDPFVVKTE